MLNHEIAIPFGSFAPDHPGAEELEVLADEIDGAIVAAEPEGSAAALAAPELCAAPGRVVIAIAASDAGSALLVEGMIDRLLGKLADLEGIAPDVHRRRHEHHDPADLAYWAEVDAARGRLATTLDIVVCTHHVGSARRTYVVTVEGPARRLAALVAAADAVPQATRRALLTAAGPVTNEPRGSAVVQAAGGHANRRRGRAEVFPGQETISDDMAVADVLACTAIDEVRSTQGSFAPGAVLRAYGFVRPTFDRGALVLTVGHDDPLVVTPWEVRYCRPCCGLDH